MIVIPAILEKVKPHVAPYVTKGDHFVPDDERSDFWNAMYHIIAQSEEMVLPVRNAEKKINPYFGYFGERWDLSDFSHHSYHNGIDIESRRKTKVHAMADGILEYSGYGIINGKYIMLSHPQITTEDGFTLHSLYMHLHHLDFAFSSYQKMLRQISLNTYPVIPVTRDAIIGSIGKTGESNYPDQFTHLHFQVEFRNKEGTVVHIDPLRVLGISPKVNMTVGLTTKKQFLDIYLKNRKDIFQRKLEKVWERFKEQK